MNQEGEKHKTNDKKRGNEMMRIRNAGSGEVRRGDTEPGSQQQQSTTTGEVSDMSVKHNLQEEKEQVSQATGATNASTAAALGSVTKTTTPVGMSMRSSQSINNGSTSTSHRLNESSDSAHFQQLLLSATPPQVQQLLLLQQQQHQQYHHNQQQQQQLNSSHQSISQSLNQPASATYYESYFDDSYIGDFTGEVDADALNHDPNDACDPHHYLWNNSDPELSHPSLLEFGFDSFGPESIVFRNGLDESIGSNSCGTTTLGTTTTTAGCDTHDSETSGTATCAATSSSLLLLPDDRTRGSSESEQSTQHHKGRGGTVRSQDCSEMDTATYNNNNLKYQLTSSTSSSTDDPHVPASLNITNANSAAGSAVVITSRADSKKKEEEEVEVNTKDHEEEEEVTDAGEEKESSEYYMPAALTVKSDEVSAAGEFTGFRSTSSEHPCEMRGSSEPSSAPSSPGPSDGSSNSSGSQSGSLTLNNTTTHFSRQSTLSQSQRKKISPKMKFEDILNTSDDVEPLDPADYPINIVTHEDPDNEVNGITPDITMMIRNGLNDENHLNSIKNGSEG